MGNQAKLGRTLII